MFHESKYTVMNLAFDGDPPDSQSRPGAPDVWTERALSDGETGLLVDHVRLYRQ